MARPKNSRTIRCDPIHSYFKPRGVSFSKIPEIVNISLEELEAARLSDVEGEQQNDIGKKMKISQSSVSRHIAEFHRKTAKALLFGYSIRITNPMDFIHCDDCGHTWHFSKNILNIKTCENCHSTNFHVHVHTDCGFQICNSVEEALGTIE